jgi:hypothetical protein
MRSAHVRVRDWVVIGGVTLAMLLLLAWVSLRPVVCAAGSCDPHARVWPVSVGMLGVALVALATVILARRYAGHVREGVSRSEGIIAIGSTVILIAGIAFAIVAFAAGGFALLLW